MGGKRTVVVLNGRILYPDQYGEGVNFQKFHQILGSVETYTSSITIQTISVPLQLLNRDLEYLTQVGSVGLWCESDSRPESFIWT